MTPRPTTGVYYSTTSHGTAVLDIRKGRGRWLHLDPISTGLWLALAAGVPSPSAVDDLVTQWADRGVDPGRVRADLTGVADGLNQAELTGDAQHTAAPEQAVIVQFAGEAHLRRHRAAAAAGLALSLVLLRGAPIRLTVAAARVLGRLPRQPATAEEAGAVHAAVRRAANWWPGRAACLEESLATFIACAAVGRRVHWALGASFFPQGAHAWTEAAGTVIGQDETDRVWPYVPVLRV
ncbi:lasso peptide biosynthesis B2 protein [Streptomyces sp. NPDC058583]|uniref:lasso peptide biosynthesis B2 protein n=1 Tax=unclassified Streptomyces TaxID=2593676 RepID=UPI003654D435